MTITVRAITTQAHDQWVSSQPFVSFLQLPRWGAVKVGWQAQSIGWFSDSQMVAAALVLYRPIPKVPSRTLAYLPEGPALPWADASMTEINQWLDALIAHCRAAGAFMIKMGPPIALARWHAATIKDAIAAREDAPDPSALPRRLSQVPPDWSSEHAAATVRSLQAAGWTQQASEGAGFGDVQPRYVFQVPLEGRTPEQVLAGFNQLWRRNVRKAEKAGVLVRIGTRTDLDAFHPIYVETAKRDGFTPRGLSYFQRMWDCLNQDTDGRPGTLALYLAEFDGHVAAATLMVRVGQHAWYSYGASTTADRDVRPSNALQWQMMQDAMAAGCTVYDLRGITDTVDSADHLFGLVQFKVGTGGYAQEYVGEWDYVLRPMWARAYRTWQARH